MTKNITIASLILTAAALTPGYASTVLVNYTTAPATVAAGVTVAAAASTGSISGTTYTKGSAVAVTDVAGKGLGLVPCDDFLQIDFSAGAPKVGDQLTFTVYDIPNAAITIYGLTGTTVSSLGSLASLGVAGSESLTTSALGTAYNSYLIAVTCTTGKGTCGTTPGIYLTSITDIPKTTTSSVPEPSTYMTAGMALIGLGLTLKKRGQKV